jgi:hypothetical protein
MITRLFSNSFDARRLVALPLRGFWSSGKILLGSFAVLSVISLTSRAAIIVSGPTFTPAPNAPLAGSLSLGTDVQTRVSVSVTDGSNTWQKTFFNYTTNHSEPLFGFHPNRTNQITVTIYDKNGNATTVSQPVTFVSPSLPAQFPTVVVLTNNTAKTEPGYTLCAAINRTYNSAFMTILDNAGQVVWYSQEPGWSFDEVRQLDNGNLFSPNPSLSRLQEMNLLGQTVKTWQAASNLPVNIHDGVPTTHGTILYLSDATRVVSNYPTSSVVPNSPTSTTSIDYNLAVEISATNGALLNVWPIVDMLDPRRLTYLTFELTAYFGVSSGLDTEHANAVLEDWRDGSILVSMREQNCVIKFGRDGKLKWILGPTAGWGSSFQPYLLKPQGTNFEWNYAQHAPMVTPWGTILLYDNGDYRASPYDPPLLDSETYSRGVEYLIDETNMTVAQLWDSRSPNQDRLYTPIIGNVEWLPGTSNVLTTYGYCTFVNGQTPSFHSTNATMVRLIETTHEPVPQTVLDLAFFDYTNTASNYLGYFCYRARRIPDLYGHSAAPVADLSFTYHGQTPHLSFSADPQQATYSVQSSADLKNWTTVGTATSATGNFDFDDLQSTSGSTRYYRVITQPAPRSILYWPSP